METIVMISFGSVLCAMTALSFIELRRIRKSPVMPFASVFENFDCRRCSRSRWNMNRSIAKLQRRGSIVRVPVGMDHPVGRISHFDPGLLPTGSTIPDE